MIYEAAYQGGKHVKKLLWELKGLSGQRTSRVSKKIKNTIGEKIWKNAQEQMAEIKVPSLGPHPYEVLDALCTHNNCQAIVYSGVTSEPAWTFPRDLTQIRPDLPSIFLEEKVSLDPRSKDLFHLEVIIRPEFVSKKFICTICFRTILSGKYHRTTCIRSNCFYCHRIRLKEGDWFDANMVRNFCPVALPHSHPAINFLNPDSDPPGQKCPNCHHRIWTTDCMNLHRKNCNGRIQCSKCKLNIIAYRGENLKDKVAQHVCGKRKCDHCREMLLESMLQAK